MAAKRCGKVFTRTNQQPRKRKQGSRTRQAKVEEKELTEQNAEPLSDKEREELMVKWAVSGFKPTGPQGFAPTEGMFCTFLNSLTMPLMQIKTHSFFLAPREAY